MSGEHGSEDRDLERGFAGLPEGMTPQQAREVRDDLLSTPAGRDSVIKGTPQARREWRALNHLAAQEQHG